MLQAYDIPVALHVAQVFESNDIFYIILYYF
jgi:hypothetical protein